MAANIGLALLFGIAASSDLGAQADRTRASNLAAVAPKANSGAPQFVPDPDVKAGRLVDGDGRHRRSRHTAWQSVYGTLFAGIAGVLTALLLIRDRPRLGHVTTGAPVAPSSGAAGAAHRLLAVSFVVLALTGFILGLGGDVLLALAGREAFGQLAMFATYLHDAVAFAFMAGLALTLVTSKPGPGRKGPFWTGILGGLALGMSGLASMFPFDFPLAGTAADTMRFATFLHGIVAVTLTCAIIGYIFIGKLAASRRRLDVLERPASDILIEESNVGL